jgi:hypothetical protein
MMRVMVFPAAFMTNTFAMMLVMIGLSLFGKPELAADFGLVHGATVALFYSFSGNARSLILAEGNSVGAAAILRLRLMLLLPLAFLAFALCIGVVDGGWLFVSLLVVRRAAEWLAEVFLSEQEIHHQGAAAMRFMLIQSVLSLILLLALLSDGALALPMTLVWALSPLLGCMTVALLGRALRHTVPMLTGIRAMLPHFGSTAVIGVSVYVFRLFILMVAGKEIAGDLFSAFALGGILGAVFSQALGPTMVRQERSLSGSGHMLKLFNLMLVLVLLAGVVLLASVWSMPQLLDWTQKNQLFWLAVGYSLIGGVVMVLAQRIRLRILQGEVGRDVFGSDMLSNILLVVSIPLLFYWLGIESLAALYLLGAVSSLAFYASERGGLLRLWPLSLVSEPRVLFILAVGVMLPIFFQLSDGLYTTKELLVDSGGRLSLLPLPFSIIFCYLGILLLGEYSRVRLALLVVFSLFVGMLLSSLMVSDVQTGESGRKMVLLVQYVLPVFALVLGQQFGQRLSALESVAWAGLVVLWVVVPLQLVATWMHGYGVLSRSAIFISVYHHFQYVPVLFVGMYWLSVFTLASQPRLLWWLTLLGFLMGIYAFVSHSILAIFFMIIAGLGFSVRFVCARHFRSVFFIVMAVSCGALSSCFYISEKALLVQEFSLSGIPMEGDELPVNVSERLEIWSFYAREVFDGYRDLFLGHPSPSGHSIYPSANNYYLDYIFNFGLIGLLPLMALIVYVIFLLMRAWKAVWMKPDLLGLAGIVMFFLIIDNSLKVGLRQPYSGISMFFLLGVLLAQIRMLQVTARWASGSRHVV